MSARSSHVPIDRLTALAFVVRAPDSEQDDQALRHIAECERCAAELARLTVDADEWRDAAIAEADAHFDDTKLEAQRTRILDRLTNLGQAARVLYFPRRSGRDVTMPVTSGSRRWVSVAAAAGLIIGLVAGQLLQFMPGSSRRDAALTVQAPRQTSGVVAASTTVSMSDEQFLDEIEAALQLGRAHSLRALDALTPTAGDLQDFPLGQR
jgi:anti-sigma factor RsiW